MALSDWNQGNDPTLEVLGAAERALSPRGFSAAESDRAAAEEAMRQAMDVEADPALPEQARTIVQKKKSELLRDFQDFNRDADEYSGKKARDYYDAPEPIEVRRQAQEEEQAKAEAEKAVQRQGLSASDYWERNPESKRTAVNSRGETVDVMDMARDYQKSQAERAEHEERIAAMRIRGQELAQARAGRPVRGTQEYTAQVDQLGSELERRGIDPKMALDKEGDYGTFSPDKARGLLSRSTFQDWDDDKAFSQASARREQAERRTLRNLRNYEGMMTGRLDPKESADLSAAITKAEDNIKSGEEDRGGLNRPSFWRRQVEDEDSAAKERNRALINAAKANETTSSSMIKNRETLNEMLSNLLRDMSDGGTPEEFAKLTQYTAMMDALRGAQQ